MFLKTHNYLAFIIGNIMRCAIVFLLINTEAKAQAAATKFSFIKLQINYFK
jgi:hypothetical protein